MRSITYCGHDFSDWCSAEVVERASCDVAADAYAVPGRWGALLVAGHVPPVEVTVRLFLDLGLRADAPRLAEARHLLRSWLCEPAGGTLVLPSDPEVEYRDALMTSCSYWDSLFEGGSCEVTFTLFDPVAWGLERRERTEGFEVGGSRPTWPRFSLVASTGSSVQVTDAATERHVLVEHSFRGGEVVSIDCATELVTIDGLDARVCVTLGSDFFCLDPGTASLQYAGCAVHECAFTERWA